MRGIFVGDAPDLARNTARPVVEREPFRAWLRNQGELASAETPQVWFVRLANTLLAYGLPVPGSLPVAVDESGAPVTRLEIHDWARERKDVAVLQGGELAEWINEHGYAEHRIDDVDVGESFLEGGSSAFDFASAGLPEPIANPRTADDLVEEAIASAWGVDVASLQTIDGRFFVGMFDYGGTVVEVRPWRWYQR